MICPRCHSKKVTSIPSSTINTNKKLSKEVMEIHKSIKNICSDCLYEFGDTL